MKGTLNDKYLMADRQELGYGGDFTIKHCNRVWSKWYIICTLRR